MTSLDLLNSLDDVIMSMSEPMFSQDSSAFFLLAQNVSKSAKVVLSGQGADEVFGGYFWYEKIMREKELSSIDTLIKYYFDRSYGNYKTIVHSDYISENHVSNDIESRLKQMDPSLSILDKVFRLELSMFIIPPLKIIKDKFFDYCRDTLLSESSFERNLYNTSYINKLLEKPNEHFTNLNGNELWHFTLLERWLQLNIDH